MSGNGKGIDTMSLGLENNKKPNWLFRYIIIVSLCIHTVIFFHIAGIYKSKTLTYMEFSLANISKAVTRSIPRPRARPKIVYQPNKIKQIRIQKGVIPHFKLEKMDSAKDLPDSLAESISMPEIPDSQGLKISDWQSGSMDGTGDYFTTNDYFDMLRLKIESCKKYPESAKLKRIEGRVDVRFVITANGQISFLEIIKNAKDSSLSKAALDAVKNAAPFPRLPLSLFKGPLHIELTILFELM
jgi:protein TonB